MPEDSRATVSNHIKPVSRILRLVSSIGLSLGMTGCVALNHNDAPSTWPTEVRSAGEQQFCGLFENQSASDPELHAPEHSYQLFDYLSNKGRFRGHRGKYVGISFSPATDTLEITLLDGRLQKLDFVSLRKDADYTFSEGAIRLKGSRTESGNVGGGAEWFDFRLSVNSSNGLLGKNSTAGAGLLFYLIPMGGGGAEWLLWPKVRN